MDISHITQVIFVYLLIVILCTEFCTLKCLSLYYYTVIFMSILTSVCCSVVYLTFSLAQCIMDILPDCNVLDKAEQLSVIVYNDDIETFLSNIFPKKNNIRVSKGGVRPLRPTLNPLLIVCTP